MSPSSPALGPVRPAAVVNEAIRALVQGAGRRLTDEEKTALNQLYEEWAAAVRSEVVEAA
ncbi:MAG: hypothetical protein HOV82_16975 [Streptomyces sp.]|nr:hypothetical protein [Streptomyces sp.]NUP36216.1 hypothetical protein [Streptomyces sp.]NUS75563.1 hypothetical protein [Streptomyces sp.]